MELYLLHRRKISSIVCPETGICSSFPRQYSHVFFFIKSDGRNNRHLVLYGFYQELRHTTVSLFRMFERGGRDDRQAKISGKKKQICTYIKRNTTFIPRPHSVGQFSIIIFMIMTKRELTQKKSTRINCFSIPFTFFYMLLFLPPLRAHTFSPGNKYTHSRFNFPQQIFSAVRTFKSFLMNNGGQMRADLGVWPDSTWQLALANAAVLQL